MTDESKFEAIPIETNSLATAEEAAARATPLELLDDSEIVELSIKPSLWFVPIVSARVVALTAFLTAVAVMILGTDSVVSAYLIVLAVLVAAVQILIASLQWASRVYILTNRRLMRLSGMLEVTVDECLLTSVVQANLIVEQYQRVLRLGSIIVSGQNASNGQIAWDHVAKADEIHRKVLRAIHDANVRH